MKIDKSWIVVPLVLAAFCCIAVYGACFFESNLESECIEYSKVKKIGICDDGYCATILENGQYKRAMFPMVGTSVCISFASKAKLHGFNFWPFGGNR